MPRGDKGAYTDKQKRKAEHIEESYEERGVSSKEAAKRAWATVNKESGGGKKSGSGRGKKENRSASKKGGKKGGKKAAKKKAGKKKGGKKKSGRKKSSSKK
jgi:plasmid stabilization system protein ParE